MADLAQRLASLSPEQRRKLYARMEGRGEGPTLKALGSRENYALSFAQQRLWILNAIQENDRAYLVSGALSFKGPLDLAAFRACVGTIVGRHAALRTVFEEIGGEAFQRVLPVEAVDVPCPVVDLSGVDQATRGREALARVEEETGRPFDLSRGPLLRVVILDMGESAEGREHIVVFTMHHIISDGWSSDVLLQEFATLYQARLEGRVAELPPLSIQYVDYAVWQRDWLSGGALDRQLDYWRGALSGANFTLDLPTDRPRPLVQDNLGRTLRFDVPAEVTRRLRELSRQQGATLYMTLLATFFLLLSRWSGENDICVGSPVANRRRVELEGLIGFFVNTLVMRGDLKGDPDFLSFLSRVRDFCLGAQEHQDLPFERLVEALSPARDLSRTPLFQTMFSMQNAPARAFSLPGVTIAPYAAETGVAKFDLSLELMEDADGALTGELEYATSLFDEATARRMAGHYLTLLDSVVATPQARVSRLRMLTPAEQEALTQGVYGTRVIGAESCCVLERFARQAERAPLAVAVSRRDEQLSYGELDRRSNQLARLLHARGAGTETIVGLCLRTSPEMIVALLAILKSGAAYLPLDPDYPAARLSYILADAGPLLTITRESCSASLPQEAPVLLLDRAEMAAPSDAPLVNPVLQPDMAGVSHAQGMPGSSPGMTRGGRTPEASPGHDRAGESLAYVIYTSGSTGRPKGTAISHASLANLTQAQIAFYGLGAGDRVLQLASPSFDLSIEEIFPALCSGATLVQAAGSFQTSWAEFDRVMESESITFVNAPTSVWRHYTHWLSELDRKAPASLRVLVTGTEAADVATLRRWRLCAPHVAWINAYGPTEATVTATVYRPSQKDDVTDPVPIGAPVANVRAYILDRNLNLAPVGVCGEICIGGAGVARGYLGAPALTAEKFIPDPFDEAGGRIYRTGDLGRWRADGQLLFEGRVDDQVKIRGYRIELGEIECALSAVAGVRAAAVLARESSSGGKLLIAYVETDSVADAATSDLRSALRCVLPEYMIPSGFIALARLPLNANGKIDRAALEAMVIEETPGGFTPPRNHLEETICRIWSETLDLDRVGADDDFFEIGGHSLLALRAVEAMRRQGLLVEARSIFTAPTPAALARELAQQKIGAPPPNLIPPECDAITPDMLTLVELTPDEIRRIVSATPGGARNIEDIYPLAPLQEGILFHHLLETQGDPYLSPLQFALSSREKLDRLVDALKSLVAQHDVLRTAIVHEGLREPVQVVWRKAEIDVRFLPPTTARAMREAFDPAHYRLDLGVAPLLNLFAAPDCEHDRWLLLLNVHHLVMDHATSDILLEKIRGYLTGSVTETRSTPYRNFVAYARQSVSRARQEAFFRETLGDFSEPTIPYALSAAHREQSESVAETLPLDDLLSRRLRSVARTRKVSVAAIFHAAYALLLARLSGRADIVFGTVMFGRMSGALTDGLGMYINTLPFRLRLAGLDVEAAVRRAHEMLVGLLEHEHAPLTLAQAQSGVRQPTPLFTALFNYRHSSTQGEAADGSFFLAAGVELIFAEERSNYPFDLSVDDYGEGFSLELQTVSGVDARDVCLKMRALLESLADALENRADRALQDLDILTPQERADILLGFNETQRALPACETILDFFAARASAWPDAVALSCGARVMTCRELDSRSNRLAALLTERGAGPERVIAVLFERSIEMIVAVLAVLKSGAAYLPLDPDYPPARLEAIAEDAAPLLILTQSHLEARLPAPVARLAVDALSNEATGGAFVRPAISGENAAYVIYTSGSTGKPKGAVIRHAGLLNLTQSQISAYGFCADDRILQLNALTFDMSVEEIFPALCSGAGLVLSPRFPDSWAGLHELIDANAVTFANAPTAVWRRYTGWLAEAGRAPPPRLRALSVGGEAVDAATLRLWRDLAPDVMWTNAYGPTETTVNATVFALSGDAALPEETTIGWPIANTQVYILDKRLEPVLLGVTGDIYVGGAGVARGYLRRPDLTAERFVPDPFGPPGSRLYRTGDLGRWRADGRIVFLGRSDDQVKVRGFRVELGEIEAALLRLDGVRAAAAIAENDATGIVQLLAYVATKNPETFDADAAKKSLRATLPGYMIPSRIAALHALPLNRNGKLDRKNLPRLDARDARAYVAPETETEKALCALWAETLGVDAVSVDDNFFELGGHSLSVMQMASRMSKDVSVSVPLSMIYEVETLRELARAIDALLTLGEPAAGLDAEETETFEL